MPWLQDPAAIKTESQFRIGSDRFIHHILNKPLKGKREFVGVLRLCIKRLWRNTHRLANRHFSWRGPGHICIRTIAQMCSLETFALDDKAVEACEPVCHLSSVSAKNGQLKVALSCRWKVSNCSRLSLAGNEYRATALELKLLDPSFVLNKF